jgi:3-phytase
MLRLPALILATGFAALPLLWGCEEPASPPGDVDATDVGAQQSPDADGSADAEGEGQSAALEQEPDYALTRVCVFNIEDLRYDDIMAGLRGDENAGAERARDAARLIAAIDPDILLVNEIEYDFISSEPMSGEAFAQLIRQQREQLGLGARSYSVFQRPSNTGVHSGQDLDRNGEVIDQPGSPGYGNDALGYGEFPGQYAMALFVAEPLSIHTEGARTFREFLWADMPGALLPNGDDRRVPEGGPWYTPQMLSVLPLSSKSHWDVPVRFPEGTVVHLLASHPTPPVFDGPEDRNGRRNHDEIRFWGEYVAGAEWIEDDAGTRGGLGEVPAIVMGDLNADPLYGDSLDNPVLGWLLANPRIDDTFTPRSSVELEIDGRLLRPEATAEFGLRVDYLLPTREVDIIRGGIVRGEADLPMSPDFTGEMLDSIRYDVSDHFPVWVDIRIRDLEQ